MPLHDDYQFWKRRQIKRLGWAMLAYSAGQLVAWLVSRVMPMSDTSSFLFGFVVGTLFCELGIRYYQKKNKHHES